MSPSTASKRPPIILAESEAERLSALALQMEDRAPFAANLLLDEIERAELRPDAEVPDDVVRMRSTVVFFDDSHGTTRTVQLVYPTEADVAAGRISVMAPVGAGLIGLAAGQNIRWPDRDGRERSLRILRVLPPSA